MNTPHAPQDPLGGVIPVKKLCCALQVSCLERVQLCMMSLYKLIALIVPHTLTQLSS